MKIGFYGDSITTGWRGISSPSRRWTSTVCRRYGWDEMTFAANGLGFVRWRGPDRTHSGQHLGQLASMLNADLDATIVSLGTNDIVIEDEYGADIQLAMDRDLTLLKSTRGKTLVLDPYWPGTDYSARFARVRDRLIDATERAGLPFLEGQSRIVRGRRDLLCEDEVHPNDAGHEALAAFLGPQLLAALEQ